MFLRPKILGSRLTTLLSIPGLLWFCSGYLDRTLVVVQWLSNVRVIAVGRRLSANRHAKADDAVVSRYLGLKWYNTCKAQVESCKSKSRKSQLECRLKRTPCLAQLKGDAPPSRRGTGTRHFLDPENTSSRDRLSKTGGYEPAHGGPRHSGGRKRGGGGRMRRPCCRR